VKFAFDAVFYYTSDLERSARFYVDVLGFKLVSRDVVARFDVDGVLFELVPTRDESKLRGAGNARLCLQVDDINEALKDLDGKQVQTTKPQPKQGGLLASFRDPDGNEICLWQYSP
jgi:catechol 2,3-dioxygenase-like lactoylglutathione lyase family enzyme